MSDEVKSRSTWTTARKKAAPHTRARQADLFAVVAARPSHSVNVLQLTGLLLAVLACDAEGATSSGGRCGRLEGGMPFHRANAHEVFVSLGLFGVPSTKTSAVKSIRLLGEPLSRMSHFCLYLPICRPAVVWGTRRMWLRSWSVSIKPRG